MKCIILVAGYATRLYPLTLNTPKALLSVKGKPILDYICDQIDTVDAVDEIILVSNSKFYDQFDTWAATKNRSIKVLNDGTNNEDERLGSIGDTLFAIQQLNIDDDIMIIAGDNLFTFSLKQYYDFYVDKGTDCVCVKTIEDKELLKRVGVCELDGTKMIGFEEKPQQPKSDKAVFAVYMYKRETLKLFDTYIKEGNKPDAPGYFLEWLHKKKEVNAFVFEEQCYDIGTQEAYDEINKIF